MALHPSLEVKVIQRKDRIYYYHKGMFDVVVYDGRHPTDKDLRMTHSEFKELFTCIDSMHCYETPPLPLK